MSGTKRQADTDTGAAQLLEERARLLRRLREIEAALDAQGLICAPRPRGLGESEEPGARDLFDNIPV